MIAPATFVYGRGLQAAGEKDRVDNATVRTVFLNRPDKKVKLITPSTLRPTILQLRLSNSDLSPAIYPSSVVQTGVKSFGWVNRAAHPSPIQSWKRMVPSVVSAVNRYE